MIQIIEYAAVLLTGAAGFFMMIYLVARIGRYFQVTDAVLEAERKKARDAEQPSYFQLLLKGWSNKVRPFVPDSLREDLDRKILTAGGLDGITPAQVVLYAIFATMLGTAFGLFVVLATGWPVTTVLACTVIGTLYPFIWLRDQVKKRQRAILTDLPYHLDLLTLCVEAGMDFGAAVGRMVEKGKPGPLREEFATFMAELRVGKTRAEALESMSKRIGLEAMSTFLSALIQADRMGSGLGGILRLQADQIRIERFQRAEKLAGEAPVKMLIPLVFFIFPTIWIILGAPLVFDWMFRGGP